MLRPLHFESGDWGIDFGGLPGFTITTPRVVWLHCLKHLAAGDSPGIASYGFGCIISKHLAAGDSPGVYFDRPYA